MSSNITPATERTDRPSAWMPHSAPGRPGPALPDGRTLPVAGPSTPAAARVSRLGKRTRRRLILIALGIVVLGGAGFAGLNAMKGQRRADQVTQELTTYAVARGDLRIVVAESGTLKAKRSQQLWPDIDGRAKVFSRLIDEGVMVDQGDTLAIMETEDLEKSIVDTQVLLNQSTANRVQAEEELYIQRRQNESDTQAAQVRLNIAKLELQRYKEGEMPSLIRDAKLKLDKAEVDLKVAQEDLVGMDEYVAKGYFTKKDLEQRKLALRTAEDGLETARKAQELVQTFQVPKDLAQKQSDVDQAQTASDLAERKAASVLAQKTASLNQAKFVENLRSDQLAKMQDRLTKMVIRAPSRGLVVYGDDRRFWERGDVQVGMDVWRGKVIITLPDLDELEVTLNINEVDLDKVKEGQEASIILDAYPALRFHGNVSKMATLADRNGRFGNDVHTFEITLEVDMADAQRVLEDAKVGNGNRLRPGMSAKVEIDVASLKNVLYVPVDAVYEDAGHHGCYVTVNGTPTWRPIEIGLSNDTHVAVTSGLAEGERVARYDSKRAPGKRSDVAASRPAAAAVGSQPASRPASRSSAQTAPASGPARSEEGNR